ncbi:hypothetical protein EC973_002157 [Apophysomyces ossiformis]|uniref:chitin synthase n=1 Tax=Apophysomyces ossiformis TaxID=679940 RepID=A0A8H7BN99_9FUNG|nr:hypothetical protein EC973_002157 [Apophysomyces ossiformis]
MKKLRQTQGENRRDLVTLASLTNESLTACLRTRYETNQPYTWIGHHLVTFPSLLPPNDDDDEASLEYVSAYKAPSPPFMEPHIFGLINNVYFNMRRTGSDQSVVLSGLSGNGKLDIRRLIVRHLVRLSSHKKESKVQTNILASQRLLEAFGISSTHTGSSRYGYAAEIQFNERGRMVGQKLLFHYFFKGYQNYDVLHTLCSTGSDEEKSTFHLNTSFRFLSRQPFTPANSADWDAIKSALKVFVKPSRIIRLLAAILHLGNLVFLDPPRDQEAAYVKNPDTLDLVADLLGLDPNALENVLVFKTTMIRRDMTTLILDAQQAAAQRDELAQCLYGLLIAWLVERINSKLCSTEEDYSNYISLVDFPSQEQQHEEQQQQQAMGDTVGNCGMFNHFVTNFAAEWMQQYVITRLFDTSELQQDGIRFEGLQPEPYPGALDLLTKPKGLCTLTNAATTDKRKLTPTQLVESFMKYNGNHPAFSSNTVDAVRHFGIQHFSTKVSYNPMDFVEKNTNQIPVDFVSLFRGGSDMPPCRNTFLVDIFKPIRTDAHPKNDNIVTAAHYPPQQQRAPGRLEDTEAAAASQGNSTGTTALGQVQTALEKLMHSLDGTRLWLVYCLQPFNQMTQQFDSKHVQNQIQMFRLTDMAKQILQNNYSLTYRHQDFLDRYAVPLHSLGLDHTRMGRSRCEAVIDAMQWTPMDAIVGSTKIFLNDNAWRLLEDQLRALEKDDIRQHTKDNSARNSYQTSPSVSTQNLHGVAAAAGLPPPSLSYTEDQRSYYSDDEHSWSRNEESFYGSDSNTGYGNTVGKSGVQQPEVEEDDDETEMSGARKRWLFLVWALTWWIPTFTLIHCGGMRRKDVRMAWREKVTLCILIFFMCAFVIWFLVFFGSLVCPHQDVFAPSELQSHSDKKNAYVAIRGEVFDLTQFAPYHYPNLVPQDVILSYGGKDVTNLFPVQVSALCQGITGEVSPYVSLDFQRNLTDLNAQYHDFRFSTANYEPDWYYEQLVMLRKNYKVGNMGYEPQVVALEAQQATVQNKISTTRQWAIINQNIYDLTWYLMGGRYLVAPPGQQPPSGISTDFMDRSITDLFWQKAGQDITDAFNNLPLDKTVKDRQLICLRNLFFVGVVDNRNSTRCQFSAYLLLIVTCLLASVIVFKFLAAVRFGGRRAPEEFDKFVICQVTCYTEDGDSLRKTIDSIATMRYDDKRKLLFVICDGMIVGSGNDQPTPRIVLDILGVDPHVDPEPLSFVSVGEGQKQHNMGKIYSGLYEVSGHVVPYIVVVKCGKPSERQKPGNRGKRDSQLVLMQFLNRVHFDAPMVPLQLEIYHQMKNVIGVHPSFYEFVLMMDADTEVMPDGLTYLVASMVHDSKIIGICGETLLANEKDTWVTMIQVYEYFISHYMIKAFESLFSTVSCLPGCFTMYRIRTLDGKRPLFASNDIIQDYSVNVVDTLHKKNLLHLGEDRYLTTLLLKHFPNFKTKFMPDAKCRTNAPDLWSVLVSQRRRWINSTIHNLGELVFLPRLCGFCCFSMRFVVMLDLVSTLVMPALLGYLGYLIYQLATSDGKIPIISVATIAGTYGLQAILFILNRKWEYILWMIVSLLAIPLFSFYIPVYAYWHFDDFSWGNTRVVVGEKGKKMAVADEGEFDPSSIPTMTWSEYEKSLLMTDDYSDNLSQSTSSIGGLGRYPGRQDPYAQDATSMYTHSMMMPSSASMPLIPAQPATPPPMTPIQPPAVMPAGTRSVASFSDQPLATAGAAIPWSGSRHSLMMDGFNGTGPRNEEILLQVKRILNNADLTRMTKKQVREELQAIFGVPMNDRKDFINACIENVLQGRV